MQNSQLIRRIATITGLSLGAFAVSAIAQTWSGPPGTPPSCPTGSAGCDAPVNVGTIDQSKIGLLALKNFAFKPTAADVGVGSVLTALDINGTVGWGSAAGIPSGAVMYFNSSTCPTGWSEFTTGRGRYVVGLRPTGTLGGTVGTALTAQENRAAGPHTHSFASLGTGFFGHCGGAGSSCQTIADPTDTGGTNAPYVQLLMCQKN